MARASDAAVRPVRIQAPDVCVERHSSGAWYARSPHPLGPYPRAITSRLDHWADRAPDRPFLAERDATGAWRVVSFGQARTAVRSIAQALLSRRLSPDRPIAILSGNSVDHALLALAAMAIGQPYAPIAPSYSLAAQDHVTLRAIWASLDPQVVFVADPAGFSRALDAVMRPGIELISSAVRPRIAAAPRRPSRR